MQRSGANAKGLCKGVAPTPRGCAKEWRLGRWQLTRRQDGEVVVDLGEARREPQRVRVRRERLVRTGKVLEHRRSVRVSCSVLRRAGDEGVVRGERGVRLRDALECHAQLELRLVEFGRETQRRRERGDREARPLEERLGESKSAVRRSGVGCDLNGGQEGRARLSAAS